MFGVLLPSSSKSLPPSAFCPLHAARCPNPPFHPLHAARSTLLAAPILPSHCEEQRDAAISFLLPTVPVIVND